MGNTKRWRQLLCSTVEGGGFGHAKDKGLTGSISYLPFLNQTGFDHLIGCSRSHLYGLREAGLQGGHDQHYCKPIFHKATPG